MVEIGKQKIIPSFVNSAMYSRFSEKLKTQKIILTRASIYKTPIYKAPIYKTAIFNIFRPKIFCIGLHKTGTTTLDDLARKSNFNSTHSTNWQTNKEKINNYNFFCDGGSHYNGINEFNYRELLYLYPNSKFIINIRNVRKWIISKCKHAGWDETTKILNQRIIPNKNKATWLIKSLENISKFIEHYCDWYIKVIEYFMDKKDRAIIVDIENKYNIDKLKNLLKNQNLTISHQNKNTSNTKLSQVVLDHIDYEINVVNKEKLDYLQKIISDYDSS